MRTTIWSCLLIASTTTVCGQSLHITDFAVSWGFQNHHNQAYAGPDLLSRVSQSDLIPNDLEDYQNENYFLSYGTAAFDIYAGLAWQKEGAATNKRLRFGLSYSQPILFSDSYFLDRRTPYDTLRSSRTGQEIYVDSLYNSRLRMNYSVTSLALSTAFLWSTNDAARFSFYGGVDLSLQVNLAARLSLERYDYSSKQINDDTQPAYFGEEYQQITSARESYAESTSIGMGSSAVLGLDWRLGRPGSNLNNLHLFSEIRPGVALNFLPGKETYSGFRNSVHLGLRFSV